MIKKFYCPVNAWDCPYWKEDSSCAMVDDGDNPVMECDDAGYFWDEEQPDCFVWVDENGKQYEMQELLEMGYHFVNGEPVAPLAIEIERIKSDVADIGSKMMSGKTVREIFEKILEEVSSPPDFDEMGSNGFRG